MKNRRIHIMLGTFVILATLLACSIPTVPTIPTSIPDDGGGPGPGPVTEIPLPPAVLTAAYIKADNVWLWTETGGSFQLTFSGGASRPSISSDGQMVSFVRNGELWAVNADGSSERVLVDSAYLGSLIPPSPDGDTVEVNQHVWSGHTIYFNTLVVAGIIGYRIPRVDLYRVNADSPLDSLIALEAEGSGGVPYISPDGSVVALVQPTKIIFMAVDGSFYTEALTFLPVLTYSEWSYFPEVVWLPDSSGVRLAVPASDPLADPTAVSTFWNVPVSGSPSVLATFVAVPAFANFPFVSPNGENVLYLAETSGMAQIHSINSAGLDTFYVWYDPGTVGVTGWAPDSVHFTFWNPGPAQAGYGSIDTNMSLADSTVVRSVRWIDNNRFFYLTDTDLRLKVMGTASVAIDVAVSEYDFAP
jgi:hypothetical protein